MDGGRIGITRAHLEEDAAKLVHAGGSGGRIAGADFSLVDFNRCGTPLVEIVTEPDIRSPEQAVAFLALLKNTLQTIGVSDCDMEKGSLRCDANVSVRRVGEQEFGTKTELKNMNSFKFLGEGMAAEIERQIGCSPTEAKCASRRFTTTRPIARCTPVAPRRRPTTTATSPSPTWCRWARARRRSRLSATTCPSSRRPAKLVSRSSSACPIRTRSTSTPTPQIADYFEAVIAAGADAKAASDLVRNQPAVVTDLAPERIAALLGLVAERTITATIAKQVLALMQADPAAEPAALVESHGLASIGGGDELASLVDEVMAAHPEFVEQFRSGKEGVINALVGQVMKRTQGRADAKQVQELLRERL